MTVRIVVELGTRQVSVLMEGDAEAERLLLTRQATGFRVEERHYKLAPSASICEKPELTCDYPNCRCGLKPPAWPDA